mgnify:FL=1
MLILHILYNSTKIPNVITENDTVVLVGDAVYLLLQQVNFNYYALENDLMARGLKNYTNAIDYKQ